MRRIRPKARDRDKPSMMPVILSLSEVLPHPLGREGMVEVEDVRLLVLVVTESSSTGSSVGDELSMHCEIC